MERDGCVSGQTNRHAAWRLDVARDVARRLAGTAGVRAIAVAGSVARGYADAYSDVELLVLWNALPDDATRHAIVADQGAEFLYPYDGPAQEDNLRRDGLQVDLEHNTLAHEEATIVRVLEDYSLDEADVHFMDTLRTCMPLHGDEILAPWKERARQYPDPLARRVIAQHIGGFWSGHLAVHAARDNPLSYYAALCALQERMFWVLLALNGMYYPTRKWLFHYLARMAVAPTSASERLRRAFAAPPTEAAEEMGRLMSETLDLVAARYPDVEVAPARQRLAARRAPLEPPAIR